MAAINLPGIPLALGDAHVLPYSAGVFDISICHFLLLWVTDPVRVVSELARTTKPGGFVLALAEPDYGGRIDYPPELSILGNWQQAALTRQGADPLLGRRLRAIFTQAGLTNVVAGLLGGQWSGKPSLDAWNMEWEVLQDDIHNTTQNNQTKELTRLHTIDEQAWEQGERVLFVPTFYAYGQLP